MGKIFFDLFDLLKIKNEKCWVRSSMSEKVPTYLTTKEVLVHLRIGRDALRSLQADAEQYQESVPTQGIGITNLL